MYRNKDAIIVFAHSHSHFVAKSRIEDHRIQFERGVSYMPYDGSELIAPYHMELRALFRTKECVELNPKWWSIVDFGETQIGRVAKLQFDGKQFTDRLADLRQRVAQYTKRSTEAGEAMRELVMEQALYDAFVEAGDIELVIVLGTGDSAKKTSVFLELRYGEQPLVFRPRVIGGMTRHPRHPHHDAAASADDEREELTEEML
jgi:hypothetical protein